MRAVSWTAGPALSTAPYANDGAANQYCGERTRYTRFKPSARGEEGSLLLIDKPGAYRGLPARGWSRIGSRICCASRANPE
jgi:hypothetical protein